MINKNILCLPARDTPTLALPVSRRVISVHYHGIPLHCTVKYRDGIVRKLVVSYRRAQQVDRRHRKDFGTILFRKEYTPVCSVPIIQGSLIPEGVIYATLNAIFLPLFLPGLLKAVPALYTADLHFSIAGPYALTRVQKMLARSRDTDHSENRLMERMIEHWGEWPISQITPECCASTLAEMEHTPALGCKRILNLIFQSEFANLIPDRDIWKRYHFPRSKRRFSLTAQVRNQLIHVPLEISQVGEILQKCEQHIEEPNGDKYFAIAITLLCGLEPEELCALRFSSISPLSDYPSFNVIAINHEVVKLGKRKRSDLHVRGPRHEIRPISDLHQNRILAMGKYLFGLFAKYVRSHPDRSDHPENYIIMNPHNQDRFCGPEDLVDWIQNKLKYIISPSDLRLSFGKVSNKITAVDYLIVTAKKKLSKESRYTEEELRYQFGLAPLSSHTDVKNYAELKSATELVKMADMQDCWVRSILGTTECSGNSKKQYVAAGKPGQIANIYIRIHCPPVALDYDIVASLHARFGLRYLKVIYSEYKSIDNSRDGEARKH
jgi:hypothetical protein